MAGFAFGTPTPPTFQLDLGPTKELQGANDLIYNDPNYWNVVWQQVLDKLGGNPSSSYYRWLQSMSNTAKNQWMQAGFNNPDLRVQDFLAKYAPGTRDLFMGLSPADRGVDARYAGRPRFLG